MNGKHKDFVRIQGAVLLVLAAAMVIPFILALYYKEKASAADTRVVPSVTERTVAAGKTGQTGQTEEEAAAPEAEAEQNGDTYREFSRDYEGNADQERKASQRRRQVSREEAIDINEPLDFLVANAWYQTKRKKEV